MSLFRRRFIWMIIAGLFTLNNVGGEELKTKAHLQNEKLWPGLNLNHFFESADAEPLTNADIVGIGAQGFRSVRIPINWLVQVEGSQIKPAFIASIKRAIRLCFEQDLAVVINVHHFDEMKKAPDQCEDFLVALWRIIASEFSEFDDRLMFELFNEPNQSLNVQRWNATLVKLHQAIRQYAPERTLIIGSAEHNGWWTLDRLELPKADQNIIVTVHYYSPFEFTHQGADWIPERKNDPPLAFAGVGQIEKEFAEIERYQSVSGRPVNIGEFGVYRKVARPDDVVEWNRAVVASCQRYGFSYHYWEYNGGFGLYKRGRWDPILTQLITKVAQQPAGQ